MRPVPGRIAQISAERGPAATAEARLRGIVKSAPTSGRTILILLCAVVIWSLSLPQIDILRMSDLGLISVLPVSFFLALVLMTVSFVLTLQRRPFSIPLVLLHLAILVVMLYGVTALVEEVPRFGSAWKHVGITEYVMRTGQVAPDVYPDFSWPGFFILSAFATQIAGLASPLSLIAWAPVAFNLMYLAPLAMIFRSATRDERHVWLGVWLFYLANWVGQDYFSPQAFTYLLYLVILAILIRWFTVPVGQPEDLRQLPPGAGLGARMMRRIRALFASSAPNQSLGPLQRLALLAVAVVLFGVTITSHQLTPVVLVASIAALAVFRRCTAGSLPILMAILAGTWIIFMAVPFLWGNLAALIQHVGQLTGNVNDNVGARLTGSSGHLLVVQARLVLSGAVWGLAMLGGIRRFRAGYSDLTFALLALAPFPLLALQTYGGEMLNRVYFFVLPLMVFFAAALFYPTPKSGTSWWRAASLTLISLALLGGFFLTRYGNERAETFTAPEVDAVQYLYRTAEPGSLFLTGVSNLPWQFQDFETYRYDSLMNMPEWTQLTATPPDIAGVVRGAAWAMRPEEHPGAYLILTRSERAYIDLFQETPPGVYGQFEQAVRSSPLFTRVYSNRDAEIFALANQVKGTGH
jgi:hypothetical protein